MEPCNRTGWRQLPAPRLGARHKRLCERPAHELAARRNRSARAARRARIPEHRGEGRLPRRGEVERRPRAADDALAASCAPCQDGSFRRLARPPAGRPALASEILAEERHRGGSRRSVLRRIHLLDHCRFHRFQHSLRSLHGAGNVYSVLAAEALRHDRRRGCGL